MGARASVPENTDDHYNVNSDNVLETDTTSSFDGIKCVICNKYISFDDFECRLGMWSYNEDVLTDAKGECVICLEDLKAGDIIARLPCLCIYHKCCIDRWLEINPSCPGHPDI